MTRHRWSKAGLTYGSRRATCTRCYIVKDARFAYGHHWTEYKRPGGEWFQADKVPECVPIEVGVPAESHAP